LVIVTLSGEEIGRCETMVDDEVGNGQHFYPLSIEVLRVHQMEGIDQDGLELLRRLGYQWEFVHVDVHQIHLHFLIRYSFPKLTQWLLGLKLGISLLSHLSRGGAAGKFENKLAHLALKTLVRGVETCQHLYYLDVIAKQDHIV
jgi:hypothetical protein